MLVDSTALGYSSIVFKEDDDDDTEERDFSLKDVFANTGSAGTVSIYYCFGFVSSPFA